MDHFLRSVLSDIPVQGQFSAEDKQHRISGQLKNRMTVPSGFLSLLLIVSFQFT